jgi:drug/metabolite transporter (DMT)-like permease
MTWALVALLGYFFSAVSAAFDKFLLSDRIPTPAVYAFFVSLFSLFALGFAPFGFHLLDIGTTITLLLSGMTFVYGLVAFYAAVKRHEVSRVAPLVGTIISLVAFLAVFLPGMAGEVAVDGRYIMALVLLIIGGLLISFDLPLRRGEHISWYIVLAGILMGMSFLFLKAGYAGTDFVNGLVWSRLGMTLAGLTLFIVPLFRHQILAQFTGFGHRSSRAASTGGLFLLNKTTAGLGTFLVAYATYLGSVSFVQALSGMQYVFLLFLTFPLSFRYPQVFGERLHFWDWFQKVVAVGIIGFGLWLATMSGIPLL